MSVSRLDVHTLLAGGAAVVSCVGLSVGCMSAQNGDAFVTDTRHPIDRPVFNSSAGTASANVRMCWSPNDMALK